MKRVLLTIIALTAVLTTTLSPVFAAPPWQPAGPNLTLGDISHGRSIISDVTNPASGAVILKSGKNQYRFGILSSLGAGFEYGDIDNLFDKIDKESKNIQETTLSDPANTATTNAEIRQTVDSANRLLSEVEQNGYGKAFVAAEVPLMPVVVATQGLGGAVVFDINFAVTTKIINLHDPIVYKGIADPTDDVVYNPGDNTFSIDNDTSLLLSGAAILEGALGYSRKVWTHNSGDLYAGVKAKYLRVGLVRVAERLAKTDDSQSAFDNIGDEDFSDSTNLGLDFGALWVSNNYRLGATLTNLNQPEFKYNKITANAENGYHTNSSVYQRLQELENYTMESQLKLEGSLFSKDLDWVVGASLDANAVKDPFGDKYQWLNLGAGFTPNSWWIPGVRVGYRTNLAGSKLSLMEGGLTLFHFLNIDVAYGMQSVTIDDSSVPRTAYVNIGMELTF